jgi:DNA-binding MarR family transcriptional regulator
MSTARVSKVPQAIREEAVVELRRSFKGALAALRRMRGREGHTHGGLSDAQYGLLFCLREHEALSAREIALASDLSPASTTEMLDGLAEAGLVERTRSERDRRVVLTRLTENGRRLVEERAAAFEPRFTAALERFSAEELQTAAAVLGGLREFFDQVADERAAPPAA